MADAKLTALTAASALAGADLFYISQGGVSKKATHTQLLTLVGTTYVPLAGGEMTGALTLPAGAVGTPSLMFTGSGATTGIYSTGANNVSIAVGGARIAYAYSDSFWAAGASGFGILSDEAALYFGGSATCILRRDADATLAQRNGTTQQIFRLYNTYTDSSNYERLTLTGVAGTSVNITAETLGTGADNLDIVLTPAGTGSVLIPGGAYDSPGLGFAAYPGTGIWAGSADYMYVLCNLTSSLFLGATRAELGTSQIFGWSSVGGAGEASADTALSRNAAGIVEVNNGTAGTFRDVKLRNLIQTEYSQMTEMTAPAAPATNSVRIYAEDNGAGKTRLMALFATGSAVQLGIEP